MTVATGNETSGRSSCFRLPQAMTPKMKSPAAMQDGDAAPVDGSAGEPGHVVDSLSRSPAASVSSVMARSIVRRSVSRSIRSSSSRRRLRPSSLKSSRSCRAASVACDDDLAAIRPVLLPLEQPEVHERIDHAGRRRWRGPEAIRDLRHPHRSGGGDQVERLELRQREAQLEEVLDVDSRQRGVEAFERVDHALCREILRCRRNVRIP